jgi:oligopeptide/dipeptide ABC transporter ATP-binding protein
MTSASTSAAEPFLRVENLSTHFDTRDGVVRALNGMSLTLGRREMLGIVGESGCGKSVLSLSIMGLIPQPPGRIESGQVWFGGRDLLRLTEHEMRRVRGNEIAMIFQEPLTSLNPAFTVGFQISESLILHQGLGPHQARRRVVELLEMVRMPDAARRAEEYPHQLSGGMRQRVMIAMALACTPKILVADEPTTALDVTIQAQILRLLLNLQQALGTAIILITHDLGVVAQVTERVIVMYAGRKVEEAPVRKLFAEPIHPYTRGLLASAPRLGDGRLEGARRGRLHEIPGVVPSLRHAIVGCAFAPRCPLATERCRREVPPWEQQGPGHWAACWEAGRAREFAA